MSENDPKLLTKISPLIEGQIPEFVQKDHPKFVDFIKHYYQYLEAGRLTLTSTVFYITQETATTSYVLQETDNSDRIVGEIGIGTDQFINGETVTGSTSGVSATVLVEDVRNSYLYISSNQKFVTGETITGGTSGSTATITEYRANPIQNIQQLLEYADVDNTIYDFLDQMRVSFMNAIPNTLASGVSKRDLLKNIKDLYSAKGTSEGLKLFTKILLGEQPDVIYPNQYMMRASDGNWGKTTIMRVQPNFGVSGDEVVNQLITGQSSGATATVERQISFQQGTVSVTEFVISNIIGTFTSGELVTGTSTQRDVTVAFTLTSMFSSGVVVNDGILHSNFEDVEVENVGNGFATMIVNGIKTGSVSGVEVDDVGSKYEVGDVLTFTSASADTDISEAEGFVSMIGGGIQLETGTLDDSSITTDTLILEEDTNVHLEPFTIILENVESDVVIGDGDTKVFTLTNVNSNNEASVTLTFNNVRTDSVDQTGTTVWTISGTTLTFTDAPANGDKIFVQGNPVNNIILDGTDVSSTDAGHTLFTESGLDFEALDTYKTDTDQIVLEADTFTNLNASSTESGAIQKLFISDGGNGYTDLPTVTITSTTGTGAALLAVTDDIGAVNELKVTDAGFNYSDTNPPDLTLRAHFVLKDVSGTFAVNNTLTSHTGTVKAFDSSTNVLDTTFENVVRVKQEQDGTFQESLELEFGTQDASGLDASIILEDEQDFDDGENIILDGTAISTSPASFETIVVKVVRNALGNNVYQINNTEQPTLVLTEGNTYYFDLSDSSLYAVSSVTGQADPTNWHQLQFSTTPDGTHGGGTQYTTGVTTSEQYINIGETGAYVQIAVATDAPDLYYYCKNHSGMGGLALTPEKVDIIDDEGSDLLLDGTSSSLDVIKLEEGVDGSDGDLRQETLMTTRNSNITLNASDANFTDQNASILLESGVDTTGTFVIIAEDNEGRVETGSISDMGDRFFLESTTLSDFGDKLLPTNDAFHIDNEGDRFAIDRYRENLDNQRLLFDATNSSGLDAGEPVGLETIGTRLVLEGTDTDASDARDKILLTDETGDGNIELNGTDSSSTDAGDDIINEDPIDFSNKDVTITDSSGATGTIVKADVATATSTVEVTSTDVGQYSGIDSIVGEDLNRIQDSYYYQDYSYEIKVGQSLSTYVNELKKAVHPAGFQPFGKVSIASTISVALRNAGTGVSGFTGDTTTFSPILASTFETIFDQTILARTESRKYEIGSRDDQIIYEDGIVNGDKIVLDGTSTSVGTTTPADVSIILESSLQPSGYDYDTAYLVLDGFDAFGDGTHITDQGSKVDVETGSIENEHENILMEDNSVLTLEDAKFGDTILYESDTRRDNESGGGRLMAETSHAPSGQAERSFVKQVTTKIETRPTPRVTRNLLIYLAETPFGNTGGAASIQLENSSSGSFESNVLILDGVLPLKEAEVAIFLEGDEDLDHIVLDGTDGSSTDAGDNILMEDGNRVLNEESITETTGRLDRIALEDNSNGVILAEADLHSYPVNFSADIGDRITLESDTDDLTIPFSEIGSLKFEEILKQDKIILGTEDLNQRSRYSNPNGLLILDQTDSSFSDIGKNILLEDEDRIALEEEVVFTENAEQNNANAVENVGIELEQSGRLILNSTEDGANNLQIDEGDNIALETSINDTIILEITGNLLSESNSTYSIVEHLIEETNSDNIILEDDPKGFDLFDTDAIILEYGGEFDRLILDGAINIGDSDGDIEHVGELVLLESSTQIFGKIELETTNRIASEGQIPIENWTLNSSANPIGGQPVIHSAEILVRTTGDIALEDATNSTSDGMLVLNGTDSSSSNAGDNFDLEGATGITV